MRKDLDLLRVVLCPSLGAEQREREETSVQLQNIFTNSGIFQPSSCSHLPHPVPQAVVGKPKGAGGQVCWPPQHLHPSTPLSGQLGMEPEFS